MDVRLPDPSPRATAAPYVPRQWPVLQSITLAHPSVVHSDLFQALARRRSGAEFHPLAHDTLSELLWHVMRVDAISPSTLGFEQEQRPTPSAGAIHPIHALVAAPGLDAAALYRPRLHQLDVLAGSESVYRELRLLAQQLYKGAQDATVLAFIAEPGLTAAKYEDASSLVWRDAGILQGTMALAAEGLGLAFRLLGATGHAQVSPLAEQGVLVGMGLALIGA